MIRNLGYYGFFFGIGGAILLVLCVDLRLGLACRTPRTLVAQKKSVQVVRKPAQAAKPKAPTPDEKKYKKELEQSKIRIKRLEQRLARLSQESTRLMQELDRKLAEERAAREQARQQAQQAEERLAQTRQQQAAEQKKLLEQQAAEQKKLAARQEQAQQKLLERFEQQRQADRRKLDAAIAQQAAALAAQRAQQDKERETHRKAQHRLNTMIAAQTRQIESDRKQRQTLEQQLARQAQEHAKQRQSDRQALERQLAETERKRSLEREQERQALENKLAESNRKQDQAREADRQAMQQKLAAQAAQLAAARRRMSELAARPRKAVARPPQRVTSWQQYLDFLAPVQSIRMDRDGAELPVLDFNGQVFADNLNSIMRFYQMGFYGMLIYRERNEKDPNYLQIDLSRGTASPRFLAKNDPREVDNLASIGLIWNSSAIGRQLMQRIQAEQPLRIPAGAFLALVNLFPRSTAQYFIWKRIEVCKRNGIDPARVNRCLATFKQTSFGTWIVVINQMELKDGRMVAVTDFEESRVVLRNG